MRKNAQAGFSMIEIMVTAGLMGIVVLGITAINKVGFMGQKTIQAQDDARAVTDAVANILSDQTACLNTFAGLNPTASNASGATVTSIKDRNNTTQFVVGTVYGNRSLKLNGMVLGGAGTDLKSGNTKWVSTGTGQGTAFLALDWLQTGSGDNRTGVSNLYRFALVNVSINGSNQITGCSAIVGNVASSGMGSAGYIPVWTTTMNLGNSVVFQNGTNVGINTATPTNALEVAGSGILVTGNSNNALLTLRAPDATVDPAVVLQTTSNNTQWRLRQSNIANSGGFKFGYYNGTAWTEPLFISTAGNLGVGTLTPSWPVHVYGGTGNSGLGYGLVRTDSNTSWSGLDMYINGANRSTVYNDRNYPGSVAFDTPGGTQSQKMIITSAGNVAIGGGASPAYRLATYAAAGTHSIYAYTATTDSSAYGVFAASATGVNFGAARADGYAYVGWGHGYLTANSYAAAFYYTSDERLKENVSTIDHPLEKVLGLRGVKFRWKKDGREDIGFVAQEVEKVVPELVSEVKEIRKSDDLTAPTYKHVAYGNVVAIVVEAVKELWGKITSHDERLSRLERENAELRARLERLEARQ